MDEFFEFISKVLFSISGDQAVWVVIVFALGLVGFSLYVVLEMVRVLDKGRK